MTQRLDQYQQLIHVRLDEAHTEIRHDSSERIYFAGEMKAVDQETYGMLLPELKMRALVPTQPGIPDYMNVYEYRTSSGVGKADLGAEAGDDVPMVEVSGAAFNFPIKKYTLGYYYDDDEIIAAAKEGKPLDRDRAMTCRRGLEERVDLTLATGDTRVGATGLLNIPSVSSYTLLTKAAGGTGWGVVGAPNATGKEAAADVMGLASAIVSDSREAVKKVVIVLPLAKKEFLEKTPFQTASDKTIMQFIRGNAENIEDIISLDHCTDYGGAGSHRMMAFERNRRTVAALVNREYTPKPPSAKNFRWQVIASMKCGGVVCRYKVGAKVADGL